MMATPERMRTSPKSVANEIFSEKKKYPKTIVRQKLMPIAMGITIENFVVERALKKTRADKKMMAKPARTLIRINRLI